jgi:cyclopropane-fatty-acyl-phospholipid synthase
MEPNSQAQKKSAGWAKNWAAKLLGQAQITIDGDKPWDIAVHNDALYWRVIRYGSMGLGEAYMDGWWDAPSLDQFFYKLLSARLDESVRLNLGMLPQWIYSRLANPQTKSRAFEVGKKHYDIGNDLYEAMLDPLLIYSCGYWKNAKNLQEAQVAKLDLICKKIGLASGDRVLDIGGGWGGFAKFAAQRYGAKVTMLTVSRQQAELAKIRCQGLSVDVRLQDYRNIDGIFDRIVSVGMFEHVGVKNYRQFMQVAARCLADDGLFLLHTIGSELSEFGTDPWFAKYIFPNSMLPSIAQIGRSLEELMIVEDWHNFGADYDLTLMAWFANFDTAWPSLEHKYGPRFYRMWKYYLLICAGNFRARRAQLWQIVLSKHGMPGGYQRVCS